MEPKNAPIRFSIYRGETLLREETIDRNIIKIGTLPSSHLRLEDDAISRMHAVIETAASGEFVIVDLGSAGGTSVNGRRVTKSVLKSGDAIVMGALRVVVAQEPVTISPPPFAAPVAAPPAFLAAVTPPAFVAPVLHVVPSPSLDDLETAARATDVVVMWGENPLHAEHLSPPRSYFVGEGKTDYVLGSDIIGAQRMQLVREAEGRTVVIVPAGATATLLVNGARQDAEARLAPSSEVHGAREVTLGLGETVRVEHGSLTFVVRSGHAGKTVARETTRDRKPFAYLGAAFAANAVFLTMFGLMPPAAQAINLSDVSRDSRLVDYLVSAQEMAEQEPLPEEIFGQADSGGQEGGRAQGDEGQAGDPSEAVTNNAYAVRRRHDGAPALPRERTREEMMQSTILGVLAAQSGAMTLNSVFSAEAVNGVHEVDAVGAIMGQQIGPNFGLINGLGMRGTGIGANGIHGGVGMGQFTTMGRDGRCGPNGCGTSGGDGDGNEYGRTAGTFAGRRDRVPVLRPGTAVSNGGLSAEVIRRHIRRRHNEFKACYESALQTRPDLEGRVTAMFQISPAGSVSLSSVSASTIRNSDVEQCVMSAVRRLTFPQPDGGGVVTVTYPFVFASE